MVHRYPNPEVILHQSADEKILAYKTAGQWQNNGSPAGTAKGRRELRRSVAGVHRGPKCFK